MMKALAVGLMITVQSVRLAAAEAVEIEKLTFQFDEYGAARAIGIVKNTSQHLIAIPTLKVTFVTKQHPTVVITKQLGLSSSLKAGESRPFHSGDFSGPPFVTAAGELAPEQITEIKSARIHPASAMPPSPDWTERLAFREGVSIDAPALTFEGSRLRGIKGKLSASAGLKIQAAEVTAACYDAKGELVDVMSFSVRARDGKCIESLPFSFEATLRLSDPRIAVSSVKCLCDRVILCQ